MKKKSLLKGRLATKKALVATGKKGNVKGLQGSKGSFQGNIPVSQATFQGNIPVSQATFQGSMPVSQATFQGGKDVK